MTSKRICEGPLPTWCTLMDGRVGAPDGRITRGGAIRTVAAANVFDASTLLWHEHGEALAVLRLRRGLMTRRCAALLLRPMLLEEEEAALDKLAAVRGGYHVRAGCKAVCCAKRPRRCGGSACGCGSCG